MDLYLLALASLHVFSPTTADELIGRIGSLEAFFTMPRRELATILGANPRFIDDAVREKALATARNELEYIERSGIEYIPYTSDAYPQRLLACDDAPVVLFKYGTAPLDFPASISIVGTRHATAYGIDFVNTCCSEWVAELIVPPVIVSGLAFGIDISAHRGALSTGLPTVAVVAHGLNTLYPAVHRQTAADIVAQGGAIVTEYLSSDAVHKGNFLARNRIVAGLTDGVLVVESAERGGALVTARLAADYSREVMALPGRSTDQYSRGCNNLIARSAAHLVTSGADIADLLGWKRRSGVEEEAPSLFPSLTDEEEQIVNLLTLSGDASLNTILTRVNLPSYRLMSILLDLEFRGIIVQMPGGAYRAKS